MEKLDLFEVHKAYGKFYDRYRMIGSYRLLIPVFRFDLQFEFMKEGKLNIIELYICRCISRGINEIEAISFCLGMDEVIVSFYINQFIELNYLQESALGLVFTETGTLLFEQMMKRVTEKVDCELYYDTLKGTYTHRLEEGINNHRYIGRKEAAQDISAIMLEPRHYGGEMESVKKYLYEAYEEVRKINLSDRRTLYYHEVCLMVYYKDEKYKMLCYDPCGCGGIDPTITEMLQSLYESGELYEVISEHVKLGDILVTDIFKGYEKELAVAEDEEIKEVIQEIQEVVKIPETIRYIMNYEIREKFMEYMSTAKESLYIISPWMNRYIINGEFLEKLEALLKRGVKIRIIYGIGKEDEDDSDFRNNNSKRIAKELEDKAKPYGDLFRIVHGQTHEKLVICDRKYYINGSFNFLSYSGEPDGKFRNEGSTYSENVNLINQTIKLRFNE